MPVVQATWSRERSLVAISADVTLPTPSFRRSAVFTTALARHRPSSASRPKQRCGHRRDIQSLSDSSLGLGAGFFADFFLVLLSGSAAGALSVAPKVAAAATPAPRPSALSKERLVTRLEIMSASESVSGVADTGCILRIAEYFLLWKNPVKNSPARRMSQGGQAGAGDRNVAHRSVRDRIGVFKPSASMW